MQSSRSENMELQLSVLIPWSGRPELARTLEHNIACLKEQRTEVIVVNCGGSAADLAAILQKVSSPMVRAIEIPASRFNKALALNIGIDVARADTVLTLDSDVLLNSETLLTEDINLEREFFSVESMREESPVEQPLQFLQDLREGQLVSVDQVHSLRFTWADGSKSEVRTARKSLVDGNRAGAGLLMVLKRHLVAVGGFNSSLESWGWEDNDIQFRLEHVLQLRHVERGYVVHITHGDDLRAMHGKTRADLTFFNLKRSLAAFAQGKFEGSLHADVREWRSRLRYERCFL